MTAEQVIEQAKSEVADVLEYKGTTAVLLRRLAVRQQQLFSVASEVNPDWSLAHAVAVLQPGGRISLDAMLSPDGEDFTLPRLERIVRIEVEDSGGSTWEPGTEIHVVPRDDTNAELPPRVFALGNQFRQVEGDLGGVDHIRIYYARRPQSFLEYESELEIPDPHGYLLVYDLARFMLRRAGKLGDDAAAAVDALLKEEEAEAEKAFVSYVSGLTGTVRRFH